MRTDRIFCSKEELLLNFHKRRATHVKVIKVIKLICKHCGSSFVLYCGKLYRKTSYMSIVFRKILEYYRKTPVFLLVGVFLWGITEAFYLIYYIVEYIVLKYIYKQ